MGQLTDSLRATLRELSQSDARLFRALQEELGETGAVAHPPKPRLAGEALASREELQTLSIAALWGLCKARGIKGLSKGPADQQVAALLNHPDGPPLRSELPVKTRQGGKGVGASGASRAKSAGVELGQLAQRLDRLERLVLLIAERLNLPPETVGSLLNAPVPQGSENKTTH